MSIRRVAIVETYPLDHGEEQVALSVGRRESELARFFTGRDFEARCFRTTRSERGSTLVDGGIEWRFAALDSDTRDHHATLTTSAEMIRLLREYSPDIVFVKGVATKLSSEILKLRVPIRLAIIGGAHRTSELTRYHLVLTETPAQDEFLGLRLGVSQIFRWPKFASSEFFETSRLDRPAIDVLVVGRLIPLKNVELLAKLPPRDYRLAICGDGPLRASLEAQFKDTGNTVTFVGHLSTPELVDTLARSTILAHPSRSEGVPRAIVEAMAAGTPPVFLDGVIDSPFLDGSNSVRASPESFCDEICFLLDDVERVDRLSKACRLTAQSEFSAERLESSAHALLERIAEIGARGRIASWRSTLRMTYRRARWAFRDLPVGIRAGMTRWRKRLAALIRRITRMQTKATRSL